MKQSILAALICAPSVTTGAVYLNQQQALELAFPPPAAVDRRTIFLSDEQARAVDAASRSRSESRVVTYYVGRIGNGIEGYAFFETNIIRTMPETFMVLVDTAGAVQFVEILAFYEPEDYRPPKKWLQQFDGKDLQDDLQIKRGIRNITGATLTTQSITDGVRRILAIAPYAIANEFKGKK